MSLKTVSKTIGDVEYQTTQFPAMKALEVMVLLQRLSAPTQGIAPSTQLSAAAPALFANLNPGQLRELVIEMFQCTTALVRTPQGSKLVALTDQKSIDLVFSGKLQDLFEVFGHAVEVNFGNFSEGSANPAPPTQTLDQ